MRVSPIPCLADDALANSARYADALLAKYAREELHPTEVPGVCRFAFEDSYTIDEVVEGEIAKQTAARVLLSLSPREERVIRLRFGIGVEECGVEAIADEFGLSYERVRQIEAKALRKLKHPSRWDKKSLRRVTERPRKVPWAGIPRARKDKQPSPGALRQFLADKPRKNSVLMDGKLVGIVVHQWLDDHDEYRRDSGQRPPYALFYHEGTEWLAGIDEIFPFADRLAA